MVSLEEQINTSIEKFVKLDMAATSEGHKSIGEVIDKSNELIDNAQEEFLKEVEKLKKEFGLVDDVPLDDVDKNKEYDERFIALYADLQLKIQPAEAMLDEAWCKGYDSVKGVEEAKDEFLILQQKVIDTYEYEGNRILSRIYARYKEYESMLSNYY